MIAEVKLNLKNHLGIPKDIRCDSILWAGSKYSVVLTSRFTPRIGTLNLSVRIRSLNASCWLAPFNSLFISLIGKQLISTPFTIADLFNLVTYELKRYM